VDQVALSKQMLEARLQVMRAQIEPHFLFNTLANVKRLCQTDSDRGLQMLDNLVLYLRAALPRMREAQTTLGQEAELVGAYLAVLQIRMGTRLRYSIDIPTEVRQQPFPPMMLLTLVENAIKHGLNPSPFDGAIAIHAEIVGHVLSIRVADSGIGFGVAATGGTGIGLANTRARLTALYGDGAELALHGNEPTGVIAVITLPYHRSPDISEAKAA
jgi:LytS/YehU family sensor histidine kinase